MKINTLKSLGAASMIALFMASCAETPSEVKKGCTNPDAVNYDTEAAVDNGGCVVIQQRQYSLFYKYTATWCHSCGEWGGQAFDEVTSANHGKILAFTVQCTDDFTSESASEAEVYAAFSNKWSYTGTPNFQCNNVGLDVNYYGAANEINTHNALSPDAGIGIQYTVGAGTNAGKLNINVYTKFFKPASGEYFAGVYILHKSIVKSQNVAGTYVDTYEHHHVLISHVSAVFGDPIASGNIGTGKVYHLPFVFPYTNIVGLDLGKMEVVGILWKKNGSTYDVVNVTPNV